MAQLLGPDGRPLLTARPSNVRRWAGINLGAVAVKRKPGQRPPVDLRAVAVAAAYVTTTSPFAQRLAYERVMARHVPLSQRRDLKPVAYVHLDHGERFPRPRVVGALGEATFGPFRDRKRAEAAADRIFKLFRLRPCELTFEPDPALPLGIACLYAQVRSCSAPCLARVSETGYRSGAGEAARWLADSGARAGEPAVAAFVGATDRPALVAERGADGIELYPVVSGAVLDGHPVVVAEEALEGSLARLEWPAPDTPGSDERWLSSWLHERRRTGRYVAADGASAATLAARIRAALETPS